MGRRADQMGRRADQMGRRGGLGALARALVAVVALAAAVSGEKVRGQPAAVAGAAKSAWYPKGGARYVTSHAAPEPLPGAAHAPGVATAVIREYHFHVYFFQNNEQSVADARRMQDAVLDAVRRKDLVVVTSGMTQDDLPGLETCEPTPNFNLGPVGPHPIGSFEIWVPYEHLAAAMSLVMLNRGETSVLLHPLSDNCVEDHVGRAMWLGPSLPLDPTLLRAHDADCDGPQYRGLGLGYSRREEAAESLADA